jgi:hypothetical protein
LVALNIRRHRIYGSNNHEAWLHFRQAAEALRMSSILHPLMASLSKLHRGVWGVAQGWASGESTQIRLEVLKPYHWFVIQLLREAGIPDQGVTKGIEARLQSLWSGVEYLLHGQVDYHKKTHSSARAAAHRMHQVTKIVFGTVVLAVVCHLIPFAIEYAKEYSVIFPEWTHMVGDWIHRQSWLLMITAGGPALAAALHGINSKVEFHRIAKNSSRSEVRLGSLIEALRSKHISKSILVLRALSLEVAEVMFAEDDAWADLMADQELNIPA